MQIRHNDKVITSNLQTFCSFSTVKDLMMLGASYVGQQYTSVFKDTFCSRENLVILPGGKLFYTQIKTKKSKNLAWIRVWSDRRDD